jgi:hypothetical protein
MDDEPLPWRTRLSWALTRGRTIERQAEGLRRDLARLANQDLGAAADVQRSVSAIREQLVLVEVLASRISLRPPSGD